MKFRYKVLFTNLILLSLGLGAGGIPHDTQEF